MKDFLTYIKRYSTRDVIYFFSAISIEIFKRQMHGKNEGLKCGMDIPVDVILHGFIHRQEKVMLSAWDISNIAYLSIMNANDYRKLKMNYEEIGTSVNLYRRYENEHSGSGYLKEAEIHDVFKFIMGMTYEQFKFQNLSWTYQNFNRNYHLLVASKNICRDKIVDINIITKEMFGLNVDETMTVELIILWLCSQNPDPLSEPEELYRKKEKSILTKENIKKIIDYYAISYYEVREARLKKQIFYTKPFVITQKNQERLVVCYYLVHMLFADGLYWLVRDYYQKKGWGTKFINAFGEMFENYFEEIADIYLTKEMWHKIPEHKTKSADYFVETENAVFLFELKSGLLGINGKQQVPDVQQIDTFYKRNIVEAYQQLKASEEAYKGEKPVIKIFLLYENTTNTQIIMPALPQIFIEEQGYYIMTIEDWEMMLVTYKNDKDKFKKIEQILIQNKNDLLHFESVLKVLNDFEAIGNLHFIDERNYFGKIMKKLELELKL